MRNLIAVLSCGASLGLAFTPSNVLPIGGDKCRITTAASVAFDATCRHRRLTAAGSTRRFLFSPEHGDHDGGVVLARPNKKSGAKSGGGGGWGSWAKVVSQRKEQEQVLKKFAKEEGGGLGAEFNNLRVRTGQKGDMLGVSQLCVDTFRGPFEWYMLPLQLFQVFSFYGQINGRLGRVTRNDIQHSMVVVEDTRSRKVVGFLEIGMLPKPTSSEESALAGKSLPAATAAAAVAAAGEENIDESGPVRKEEDTRPEDVEGESDGNESDEEWAGSTAFERSPDVVYLANVVVDRDQRRRGIGRTIVKASLEIVKTLWPAEKRVYVSVEQGNDIAVALYEGMGFELAALEDEMLARSRKRPPRIYLLKALYT